MNRSRGAISDSDSEFKTASSSFASDADADANAEVGADAEAGQAITVAGEGEVDSQRGSLSGSDGDAIDVDNIASGRGSQRSSIPLSSAPEDSSEAEADVGRHENSHLVHFDDDLLQPFSPEDAQLASNHNSTAHDLEPPPKRIRLDSPTLSEHQDQADFGDESGPVDLVSDSGLESRCLDPADALLEPAGKRTSALFSFDAGTQMCISSPTGWLDDIVINDFFRMLVACRRDMRTFSSLILSSNKDNNGRSDEIARLDQATLTHPDFTLDRSLTIVLPLHVGAH